MAASTELQLLTRDLVLITLSYRIVCHTPCTKVKTVNVFRFDMLIISYSHITACLKTDFFGLFLFSQNLRGLDTVKFTSKSFPSVIILLCRQSHISMGHRIKSADFLEIVAALLRLNYKYICKFVHHVEVDITKRKFVSKTIHVFTM